MTPSVEVVIRAPTLEEYAHLRSVVGWGQVAPEGVLKGLDQTLFSVCLVSNSQVVGCGRIVGDGGIYFYIQDIIVTPALQGQGLGDVIMNCVMDYLREHAVAGSFIGLMAAQGVKELYHRYGFEERPDGRPGMFMVWPLR